VHDIFQGHQPLLVWGIGSQDSKLPVDGLDYAVEGCVQHDVGILALGSGRADSGAVPKRNDERFRSDVFPRSELRVNSESATKIMIG